MLAATLIHVPTWGNASVLEVAWLVSGVAAAILTGMNLIDSWKDQESLDLIREDPTVHRRQYRMIELAAKGRTSSQLTRFVISLLITATGIVGVRQPNPLGGRTTVTGLTVTICLVLIAVLTATRSYLDHRQRNHLYEMALERTDVITAKLRAKHAADIDQQEAP